MYKSLMFCVIGPDRDGIRKETMKCTRNTLVSAWQIVGSLQNYSSVQLRNIWCEGDRDLINFDQKIIVQGINVHVTGLHAQRFFFGPFISDGIR